MLPRVNELLYCNLYYEDEAYFIESLLIFKFWKIQTLSSQVTIITITCVLFRIFKI